MQGAIIQINKKYSYNNWKYFSIYNIIILSKNPFIKHFFPKRMVIEILLNNDIQLFFCSNDFKLLKINKCNYVHYFLKIKKETQIISFEQHFNKIWIFKVHVFVMFKMKYLINKM
jgi:hypothetical protein